MMIGQTRFPSFMENKAGKYDAGKVFIFGSIHPFKIYLCKAPVFIYSSFYVCFHLGR